MDEIKIMYIKRTLENFITKANRQFPVLLLTGARQVGKTTLLRYLSSPDRTYVTLDDPIILSLAKEDPALFMQRFSHPLMIDEIQYAPQLLPHIKMAADNERTPGMFWLTGSQQFHLMKGVSESLAGRVGIINLLGFSRLEKEKKGDTVTPFLPDPGILKKKAGKSENLSLKELYEIIWRGSFPAISAFPEMDRELFYASYVQTYLQRDVRDLARVGNEMAFLRFLRAAAARTGQLLNLANLARDSDISPNTAKAWLSILQASGIVYLLEPYYSNLTKRLVKAPKLYFMDTGLCAYLTEWSSPMTLEAGAMSGPVFETWVITELLKTYLHNGIKPPFYYYRDKDKKEIDLLIVKDGKIYPLEIKKSASPRKSFVKHFPVLNKLKIKTGAGGVICLSEHFLPLDDNIFSIPVSFV